MSEKRIEFVKRVTEMARLHGTNDKRFAGLFEARLDAFLGKAPAPAPKIAVPTPAPPPPPTPVKFGDSDA